MFRIQLLRGDAVQNISEIFSIFDRAVASAQLLVATTSVQGGRPTGYQIMNECHVVVFRTIA